jgi:hypothetical protein
VEFTLTTADGDAWKYDTFEAARYDKYIFGGKITINNYGEVKNKEFSTIKTQNEDLNL